MEKPVSLAFEIIQKFKEYPLTLHIISLSIKQMWSNTLTADGPDTILFDENAIFLNPCPLLLSSSADEREDDAGLCIIL